MERRLWGATLDDVGLYSLQLDGPAFRLGDHFRLIEFACKDGTDLVLVHPRLVEGLGELRDEFGRPVHLSNGYRTPAHNFAVGGRMPEARDSSTGSRHLWGFAADVVVRGVEPPEVQKWADARGWGGVGSYASFTHLDVWGQGRRW